MQNLFERTEGLRPFQKRQNTERCPGNPWHRNCKAVKGTITGGGNEAKNRRQ